MRLRTGSFPAYGLASDGQNRPANGPANPGPPARLSIGFLLGAGTSVALEPSLELGSSVIRPPIFTFP